MGGSALSPERAASSTLEHSCGAEEPDSEFPPHVVEGRKRAQLQAVSVFRALAESQAPLHGFCVHRFS